jgi:hypothetical protein
LCPALNALLDIEGQPDSFMARAKSMRDFVVHRGSLPMQHYLNGPSNIFDPEKNQEFKIDPNQLLRSWLDELENFFKAYRTW